eukprot:353222-Chlamydomonas_euryale.AAC.12
MGGDVPLSRLTRGVRSGLLSLLFKGHSHVRLAGGKADVRPQGSCGSKVRTINPIPRFHMGGSDTVCHPWSTRQVGAAAQHAFQQAE